MKMFKIKAENKRIKKKEWAEKVWKTLIERNKTKMCFYHFQEKLSDKLNKDTTLF